MKPSIPSEPRAYPTTARRMPPCRSSMTRFLRLSLSLLFMHSARFTHSRAPAAMNQIEWKMS